MHYSRSYKTGDGSSTDWTFPFPYIHQDHLRVLVDGAEVPFVMLSENSVRLEEAPASGSTILIYRRTSPGSRLVDYSAPSDLSERDLDNDSLQAFYLAQESLDDSLDALSVSAESGTYSLGGRRLSDVGDPALGSDAATRGWVESITTDIVSDAQAARDAAISAKDRTDTLYVWTDAARDDARLAREGASEARVAAVDAQRETERLLGEAQLVLGQTLSASYTGNASMVIAGSLGGTTPDLNRGYEGDEGYIQVGWDPSKRDTVYFGGDGTYEIEGSLDPVRRVSPNLILRASIEVTGKEPDDDGINRLGVWNARVPVAFSRETDVTTKWASQNPAPDTESLVDRPSVDGPLYFRGRFRGPALIHVELLGADSTDDLATVNLKITRIG